MNLKIYLPEIIGFLVLSLFTSIIFNSVFVLLAFGLMAPLSRFVRKFTKIMLSCDSFFVLQQLNEFLDEDDALIYTKLNASVKYSLLCHKL